MKIFLSSIIYLTILSCLTGCWYYTPWRDIDNKIEVCPGRDKMLVKKYGYKERDLPWNGENKRPSVQRREFCAAMQSSGCSIQERWKNSFFDKQRPERVYVKKIDQYLIDAGVIKKWSKEGEYISEKNRLDKDERNRRTAPYDFTMVSINPIIVIMTPYDLGKIKKENGYEYHRMLEDSDNYISSYSGGCSLNPKYYLYSVHLENRIIYATIFNYSKEILWFSPDLRIEPKLLNIPEKGIGIIEWPTGLLKLEEKNGIIVTSRFNKK